MSRQFSYRGLFVCLALGAAAFGLACGGGGNKGSNEAPATRSFPPDSTMERLLQNGKITIGVKFDVPLFGLLDSVTRKPDGFDVAVGKEIAKELGLREDQIQFVEAISGNRIPYLQEDKVDLIISTMTITDARKQQIDFSIPYYVAGQSILVLKENRSIHSVGDLNGQSVCSGQASTSEATLQSKAPQAKLLSLQVYSACISAMKDGRVDAVSTDDIILAGLASVDKDLKLVGEQFTKEFYGVGIKKGDGDLVTFVNDVLAGMMRDGRWERIYKKYLGSVQGLPSASEAKARLLGPS